MELYGFSAWDVVALVRACVEGGKAGRGGAIRGWNCMGFLPGTWLHW